MKWDHLFILQAEIIAQKSKDASTKVGCVIVAPDNSILSIGFNGFPRGINEHISERWNRPEKYNWVEHAERNAIYNAVRNGVKLHGAKLYINYEPKGVCSDCARALIQVGIKEVIGPDKFFDGKGVGQYYSTSYTELMFDEANIKTKTIPMSSLMSSMG